MVNFVAAVAYHFCLAMPAAFRQPGDHLLAEPCTFLGGDFLQAFVPQNLANWVRIPLKLNCLNPNIQANYNTTIQDQEAGASDAPQEAESAEPEEPFLSRFPKLVMQLIHGQERCYI